MAIDYESGITALRELLNAHADKGCVKSISAPNYDSWEIEFLWLAHDGAKGHRVRFSMHHLEENGGHDWNDAVLRYLKDIPRIAHLITYSPTPIDVNPRFKYTPKRRIRIRRKTN